MKRLIVATKNKGKITEIGHRLAELDIAVSSLLEVDPTFDVEEDADTFAGNAEKKAAATCALTGCPALADDSGLEVDALDGRPGVYSARYGGNGLDDSGRTARLLDELSSVPTEERGARFRAVLCYIEPNKNPVLFEGSLEGTIATAASGKHGFGYDPVFVPNGFNNTLAELGPKIKNKISHRAEALDSFIKWFARRNR